MSWFNGRQNGKYASMRVSNPLARSAHLVIEEVDDDTLIYDHLSARAHCLNPDAAAVWRACDGHASSDAIAARLDLEPDTVKAALDELDSNGLLEATGMPVGSTRREFTIKTAKIGAASAAAPMIYSVLAPTAAAAFTPSVSQCLFYSAKSCDGCTQICGCCCCCHGCSTATGSSGCKICFPSNMCSIANAGIGCNKYTPSGDSCSDNPNCTGNAAPTGPACTGSHTPGDSSGCLCYNPCTNGQATLTDCGRDNGNSQPCNCTGASNPC